MVIAALLFANAIPVWASIGSIGLLAGLRPFLKARNYLAYAAVMTPLIILILDGGRPAATAVLTDRLAATLIGAGLVVSANWLAVYSGYERGRVSLPVLDPVDVRNSRCRFRSDSVGFCAAMRIAMIEPKAKIRNPLGWGYL